MLYIVRWVSHSGFANDGEYLYGEHRRVINDEDSQNARVRTIISRHRTMQAAEQRAKNELQNDQRMRGWGTECYESIRCVR